MKKKYELGELCICQNSSENILSSGVMYVVEENNLVGIADEVGNWLLPCDYDNIVEIEDDFYIVIKNGKQGLLELVPKDDNSFAFKTVISCENDLIICEEGFAIIKNFSLSGTAVRICFLANQIISDTYSHASIWPYGLVEVKNKGERIIFDCKGNIVFSSESVGEIIAVWCRIEGDCRCFPIILDNFLDDGIFRKRFIYWDGKNLTEYKYTGNERVVFKNGKSIMALWVGVERIIITEDNGNIVELDNMCNIV